MHKFTVTTSQIIEADTAEEAALLMYQELNNRPSPLIFSTVDENGAATDLTLNRQAADAFANDDHTADPGNW